MLRSASMFNRRIVNVKRPSNESFLQAKSRSLRENWKLFKYLLRDFLVLFGITNGWWAKGLHSSLPLLCIECLHGKAVARKCENQILSALFMRRVKPEIAINIDAYKLIREHLHTSLPLTQQKRAHSSFSSFPWQHAITLIIPSKSFFFVFLSPRRHTKHFSRSLEGFFSRCCCLMLLCSFMRNSAIATDPEQFTLSLISLALMFSGRVCQKDLQASIVPRVFFTSPCSPRERLRRNHASAHSSIQRVGNVNEIPINSGNSSEHWDSQ